MVRTNDVPKTSKMLIGPQLGATRTHGRSDTAELLGRSRQLAARFEREARITARLQHPGIVPIYEIGCWPDGTPFYSMRMVEGRTLREAIHAAPTLAARLANLEGANAWPYTYNHGLAMTRDGRYLVAAATVANYAAVYSLPDFGLKGIVPVGGSPNWVVCDPEGRFAYVTNPKDDSVSVIDIESVREVARIPVGKGPKRIAFSVE